MEYVKDGFPAVGEAYLEPTEFFDYDDPSVRAFAETALGTASGDIDKAVRLFYAVRDGIRYDPYRMAAERETYRASHVLATGAAFCIPKANLLIAGARMAGIPAALGLSNVSNHLCTERLQRLMGEATLFIHHGYAVLHLGGRWVKAAPTFNIELCDKFDVLPSEFDGTEDALFQEFDKRGRRHMEYLTDNGVWSDFPYDRVIGDFLDYYPDGMFEECARQAALNEKKAARQFEDERPVT